ncbi:hypothetical protein N9U65_00390 [Planctomycetaceae bacterium]|nr:hypothetical protein [Planctomycetaceae bacterium]
MGLMHNLFPKIDVNIHRRRSKRSRSRSESLSKNIEPLEQRIALTANVYSVNNSGDSPGYLTIMLDESGDDLYVRQTIDSAASGSQTLPVLQYANNPDFSAASIRPFSTNDLSAGGLATYQDVFVSQGVANVFNSAAVGGLSPTIVLPDASQFDGVARTLPANLVADENFAVLPGTVGGNADFGGSFLVISNNAGQFETVSVATLNLLDEQDGVPDGVIDLVFSQTAGSSGTTSITLDFGAAEDVTLSGEINLATGRMTLDLDPATSPPAEVYDTSFFIRYGSPVVAAEPSTVVLAPGLTLDAGFIVDLPTVDSTVSITSPIGSPTGADGLIDLRATNVLVDAPVAADEGFRVLESRFQSPPSVSASLVDDVVTSQTVTIPTPAVPVEIGAYVSADSPNARNVEIIPPDTNVIDVNIVGLNTELTLSNAVSLSQNRTLNFYNPSSTQTTTVTPSSSAETSTLLLDPLIPVGNYDIKPGAVVLDAVTGSVPPNTFVAAVDTVTGRVDLTRSISLPAGGAITALTFFNPGFDGTSVENFAATAPIQSGDFYFRIEDDISSNVRDRGRLYVAGSSGLFGFAAENAPRLSVNTSVSDIIFEGQVQAVNQSYFFETSVAETPYSFTTKNSSGVSTGAINATTMDVQLSNLSERNPADSVVQVVDLDTAVDSLRITAGSDQQLNPPFVEDDPAGPFPFAVTIREADDLSLDAAISSAGPVDFTVGGNLALTATIQSQNDLSFSSSGTMTGTAWLTTVNGSIDVAATDVNISGLTQVLTAPFDGFSTDVSITATNGSVSLGQGVRAVNKIVIDQRGTAGSVQSNGLVSAHDVQVFSEGDVDIDTSASFVDVSVASTLNGAANTARTVTVDSDRDSRFRISTAGGTANVSALGVDNDNGTPGDTTDDIAALSLELRETAVLSATAPQGSIDVIAVTSDELVMGVAADLLQGNATNMQAAGSVEIRTTQSPVTVLDAAVAGRGQLQVRAAATGNLAGTYSQNTPGITPSTITAAANGSINGAVPLASFGGLDGTTNPLRFRDLVLLSNQTNAEENGVYQVISLGNESTPWQLRRYGLAQTTSELPVGTRVYVTDGAERGDTYRVNNYANVLDTTPLRVTPGTDRSEAEIAVRFATEAILDGNFAAAPGPGFGATITADTPLGLGIPLEVNGTPVEDGDLILVQFGAIAGGAGNNTEPSSVANGVYEVTTSTDTWVLTRYDNLEPPAAPEGIVGEAIVVVMEGFYRTSRSGGTFDVAYDGLGLVDLTIAEDSEIVSAIGSYDPRDATTLVVSTAGVTNDAAGSLGKMLTLAQANEAEDLVGQNILQELRFGNVLGSVTGNTGTIVLQQELPVIEKPIVIDASQRYTLDASTTSQVLVIDGSRITTSSESTFVTRGDEVNGLVLGELASADVSDPFRPLPSTVSSLRFGGFEQGAAVVVDGASNVLLDNLTIGQNSNDASQAVRYGVRVTGTSGVDGPVSIIGGSITSANIPTNSQLALSPTSPAPVTNFLDGAGVLLDDAAQNVQVVGTNIGSSSAANLVGVLARSTNLPDVAGISTFNSVGATEIGDFVTSTILNLFTLNIPATDSQGNAIDIDDVFVGQSVTGSELLAGTVIVSIDKSSRQVTLNQAAVLTNAAATIALGAPPRTDVENNFWGVMLESGATRIVNSDIANNIYDGIFIGFLDGTPPNLTAVIGSSTTAGSNSNAIFSNGRNGIRFAENVLSSTGATDITIQGNYIGSAVGSAFVGNTQGSYFWEGNPANPLQYAFASLGYDSTTDTPPAPGYITGDALFSALIAPVTEGGDVDSEGNENADFVDGGPTTPPSPPGPPPPTNPFA